MSKPEIPKPIPIRVDFVGEEAHRFEVVKENRGVKANNELIRLLVSEAYNEISKPQQIPAR